MVFPPIDQLPPLTAQETECWYYPVFAGRPYTAKFANQVIDLITIEERFWRNLKWLRQSGQPADIYFDVLSYGELSLPKWTFSLHGNTLEGTLQPRELVVQLDQTARLKDGTGIEIELQGDWSHRQSSLGQLVRHLLPYMETIYIVTDDDQVSLPVQS